MKCPRQHRNTPACLARQASNKKRSKKQSNFPHRTTNNREREEYLGKTQKGYYKE
jgi:hypothetical protein